MAYQSSSVILRVIIPALGIFLGVLLTLKPFLQRDLELHDVGPRLPVRILSHDPLVMHIKHFISQEESAYLVGLA
jgi:hypothetical protein